ncbi:MAG: glycosyl hydrolase [Acidimicrobiia bacterium]|nr:glycosyl hydrolase [Acidimicrobiia bacterium]
MAVRRLAGMDFSGMSLAEKRSLLKEILDAGIHGISFSPYLDGQRPGIQVTEEQIRDRLSIIQPYTNWIRSFGCIEGNEQIPGIAKEMGLKTMVGVDLSDDREENEAGLANGIAVAQAGHADILVVGNENLLRQDLPEHELLDYIRRAKEAVDIPVSFVDAYFLFEQHPAVADAVDVMLVNCYPFWEGCAAEHALVYMKEMYRRAQGVANGKPVIISETGWPSQGTPFGGSIPSFDNALEYFIRTYQWAEEDGIEIFWFSAFDEAWKVGPEGDVGAYWGLWDSEGNLKF